MNWNTISKANVAAFQTPAATSQKTAIVVPCYNEAKRLNRDEFLSFLADSDDTLMVFVNDGSKDDTLDVLRQLQSQMPEKITFVHLPKNAGKAEAVRQGLNVACDLGASYVGYWDADLATPLDAIQDFSSVLSKFPETQVVYGARRMMLGHRIERTLGRRLVSRACAMLARQAVRLPIGDTQCGAKLMRNSPLLRNALSKPFTAGWLFDVELFTRLSAQMNDKRFAFYEQPLAEWTEVPGSKVSAKAIITSGLRMLQLIAETRLGISLIEPNVATAKAQIITAVTDGSSTATETQKVA